MSRICAAPLLLLAVLAVASPAAGRSFVVSKAGNKPAVAVDAAGTAHVVWDSVGADNTSTTHYCRVARNGAKCLSGTERTFAPVVGDQDFGGPRVFLSGAKGVVVVTSRCCTSEQAPDGTFYGSRTFAISSADGGATFGDPAWIGTQVPDVGATLARGAFYSFGIASDGTALQSASLTGFAGTPRTVTTRLANSGGVGTSPKGDVVAFADAKNNVFAGALKGDPNFATINFKTLGKGSDVGVTAGPSGVDVFYKTTGKSERYIVRRYKGTKAGKISAVSEAGFPIFGTAFQDSAGRVHAVWQGDLGLTYRRSGTSGGGFAKPRRLSKASGFFNLAVSANAKGRATMVYDSNGFSGKVGGFTAG
ncbi:MAG: exo-alpha-sialidase [Solirubrobacterales bacterium]|nr:exo-alpha-sialidase [Solirubrobacterales bacterium]